MIAYRNMLAWLVVLTLPSALAQQPAPAFNPASAWAVAGPSVAPDPVTVQRSGAGYRYPQEGWIVLHLEGSPYQRGVQHGRLLAPEIEAYLRCYAKIQSSEAPADAWNLTRTMVNAVFLRGFDREFLEEMTGIADGASAAGARFDDRAIDLIDIAALNLWPELMTLDAANDANPTGLEGVVFPNERATPAKAAPEPRCSAFAATGKATRDGHAVIGHITMFGLYPSRWYNVWLDIKPERGHRLTMQSYPGGIYSGMDYYLNDAGIALVETTIAQTRFDAAGKPLASRVRKAVQYGDSIDAVVAMLREDNNGLYNNEWLLADMKTDEIAMLELGTHATKLWRSSRHQWFGGTEGFYWGCNNAKDLAVRLETIPALNDRPANMVWHPSDRDLKWLELYQSNFGSMDEAFAKCAFTTAPLCSSHALDAKFTTASLAKELKTRALFGPPRGQTWLPTAWESKTFPDIQPLVSNPWTVLGLAFARRASIEPTLAPVDLHDPAGTNAATAFFARSPEKEEVLPPTKPAWHGTILPATDGDLWLASAFAEYEGMVSLERGYAQTQPNKCLCAADYDKVANSLFAARARYFAGVREGGDVPLTSIRWVPASDAWYKAASGKGVLVLAELRRLMGDAAFIKMMDEFGRSHAGKPATSGDFAAHAAKAAGRDLTPFFTYWLTETGLPRLELVSATAKTNLLTGQLHAEGGPLPANIEVTVEYGDGELTQVVDLDRQGKFQLKPSKPVTRLVVDKYARAARANGSEADLGSFTDDVEHTLIIYGTRDDSAANREAAEVCQKRIRSSWFNVDIPIRSDAAVTAGDLKSHHLILIGRPAANAVTAQMAKALPVAFGANSFSIRGQTYAHAASAVLAAGVNPLNPRFAVIAIAGNSAAATCAHADDLGGREDRPEVQVYDASGKSKSLVAPAPELTKTFSTVLKSQNSL
jgi:Phospholipase B